MPSDKRKRVSLLEMAMDMFKAMTQYEHQKDTMLWEDYDYTNAVLLMHSLYRTRQKFRRSLDTKRDTLETVCIRHPKLGRYNWSNGTVVTSAILELYNRLDIISTLGWCLKVDEGQNIKDLLDEMSEKIIKDEKEQGKLKHFEFSVPSDINIRIKEEATFFEIYVEQQRRKKVDHLKGLKELSRNQFAKLAKIRPETVSTLVSDGEIELQENSKISMEQAKQFMAIRSATRQIELESEESPVQIGRKPKKRAKKEEPSFEDQMNEIIRKKKKDV